MVWNIIQVPNQAQKDSDVWLLYLMHAYVVIVI